MPLRIRDADGVVEDSAANVDHLDDIAAEGRNEQPTSSHGKVVKTTLGVIERNGLCENERLFCRGAL